jgi:hypothetical protein
MLSLELASFNRTSIESTFSPDGLRMRLLYFTGSAIGTGVKGRFPPRDQTLGFRIELEQVYRVDLGRSPGQTAVDIEGNAVWLQEYLRYRLHGCTHAQASTKVMLQIEGHGIQPVCL